MEIALISLGMMGANIAQRLLLAGHKGVGCNRSPEVTRSLASEHGLTPAFSLPEAVAALNPPRLVWVMVPSGTATEETVQALGGLLSSWDVLIDGGNTYYKDDPRRSSPWRCRRASSAARKKVSPPNCWRRCATSSAVKP